MAEKRLFFGDKIGDFMSLGDPIMTNYTIFRNFRARPNQWISLFRNLKTSKI